MTRPEYTEKIIYLIVNQKCNFKNIINELLNLSIEDLNLNEFFKNQETPSKLVQPLSLNF